MSASRLRRASLFRLAGMCALVMLGACSQATTPEPTVAPLVIVTASLPVPTSTRPAPDATQPPPATAAPTDTPAPSPSPTQATAIPVPAGSFNPDDYALAKIADGFQEPLLLTYANDGSGRLFVVEQPGTIRILQNGTVLPEPLLDITARINDRGNEQGLLGLAFHPNYATNGQFFVNYTDLNGDTVVARFAVSADPNRADPDSEKIILSVDQPYANHNGGNLAFGPDGYLYIGLGDGGSAGDPENRAQNLSELLGKMLRLDVDGGDPYAIPPDNPFVGRADAAPEIWAYGLRNPWRFSFDRATGDLYIADVGQNQWEEVDFQPAASRGGENYGWRFLEGTHPYKGDPPAGVVMPVAEYSHDQGGCSVTGGFVYRGQALPALNGVYLFADYCSGILWSLARDASGAWKQATFGRAEFQVSSFGEDPAGELYLLSHRGGEVYQLELKP